MVQGHLACLDKARRISPRYCSRIISILTFREWAEPGIKILDDMISRQCVYVPLKDGSVSTKTLHEQIEDPEGLGSRPAAHICSNVDHLCAREESVQKGQNCSSVEDILELVLGASGPSNTLPRPGWNETGLEVYYWPRFHIARGVAMGNSYTFTTRDGYFALGLKTIRAGDVVTVILGRDVPVVMRLVGHRYIFFGQCYVEGLMDGHGIQWVKEGSATEHELEIVSEL